MRQPFWLRVTGSRNWYDAAVIQQALAVILARHPEGVVLVHGGCPRGADAIAAAYAAGPPGYRTDAHPADWCRYGRAAGYRRNAAMIALGADGCPAFIRGSRLGSTSTVRLAKAAGTPPHTPDRPAPRGARHRCQHCCQAAIQRPTSAARCGISAQHTASDRQPWTACPLLRVRRLGVRLPPSAPRGYRQNCRCHTDRTASVTVAYCACGV